MSRLNEPENLTLCKFVREFRVRRSNDGLTRKEVAAELGVTGNYLAQICDGIASFSFPMGMRLLRALRISVSEFEKAMEAA